MEKLSSLRRCCFGASVPLQRRSCDRGSVCELRSFLGSGGRTRPPDGRGRTCVRRRACSASRQLLLRLLQPSQRFHGRYSVVLYHPLMLSAPASTDMHFRALIALLGAFHMKAGGGGSGFLPHDCLCVWFQLISCDADGSSSCKHCGRVSNVPGRNGNEATVSCVRMDLGLF